MIDPTWLIIGFFFVTMLFLVFIGGFVFKMLHTLEAIKTALEVIQKSTQGTWYIVHDLKSAMEGVHNELQQQNKFIKKKDGVIISGQLPEPNTNALPATIHGKSGRPKKEKTVEAAHDSVDTGHDVTATQLPVIRRESVRS